MSQREQWGGWGAAVAVALLVLIAQWHSEMMMPGGLFPAVVWFPGPIVLAALLALPTTRWPLCIGAAVVGSATACIGTGRDILLQCVTLLGELALVAAAAWLLLRPHDRLRATDRLPVMTPDLARFVVVVVVLLPVIGAAWVIAASQQLHVPMQTHVHDGTQHVWLHLVLKRAQGYLLVVPAFVAIVSLLRRSWPVIGRRLPLELLLGAVFATALFLAWSVGLPSTFSPMLLLGPIAIVVWATRTFGMEGGFLGWAALYVPCVELTAMGRGPLVAADLGQTLHQVQGWGVACSLLILLLASVAHQRREARASLQQAYAQLSELARKTMLVQEEERSRIARELHDGISQSLASISIEMSALKRPMSGQDRTRAAEIQEHLLEVTEDVRQLSHDLHPSMLRYTSLAASLATLCEGRARIGGLRIACDTLDDMPLSEVQKLNLFRVAQEALHNVERHARASVACVSLFRDGDEVVLRIDDDGIGLPPGFTRRRSPGLGMVSIGERMKILGGRYAVGAGPAAGTRLEARMPLGAADGRLAPARPLRRTTEGP